MTDLLRQMAYALRLARTIMLDNGIDEKAMAALKEVFAAYASQQAAEQAGCGEAVAWLWEWVGSDPYPGKANPGGLCARSLHEMDPASPPFPNHWKPVRPLYTHPAPAAPVQQVGELPPLPIEWRKVEDADGIEVPVFRAFQMWDYARAALSTRPELSDAVAHTYASTQATNCASCGKHKHTPLRIDAMGGYVCLTCIDKKLGGILGEFGCEPDAEIDALRRDAERYRWLRDEAWGCNNKRGPHLVEFKPGYLPSAFTDLAEEAADAAIDAALAAARGEKR